MSMSLKAKFRVLFACVILVSAVAGWAVVNELSVLNSSATLVVDHLLPRRNAARAAASDATLLRLAEARHILATDDKDIAEEDAIIKTLSARVDDDLNNYRNLLDPGDDTAPVDKMKAMWSDFMRNAEAMLALSRANQNDAAHTAFIATKPSFQKMLEDLDALVSAAGVQMTKAKDLSYDVYVTTSRTAVGLVIGILIAAITTALYFEQNVTRAIVRL